MTTQHLPSLVLEEIVTGERSRDEAAIALHLDACEQCLARLQALEQEDRAFYQDRPPAPFLERVVGRDRRLAAARRRIHWRAGLGLAAAAAAIALLWVLAPWSAVTPSEDDIRLRGSAAVQTLVVREGTLRPVQPDATLAEGTRVRFRVQTDGEFACIFHVCGKEVKPLHPGLGAMQTSPGTWLVPGTYELIQTVARDHLVLVLFDGPADCLQAQEKLRGANQPTDLATARGSWLDVVVAPLPRIAPRGDVP
jgi:hypothetical protein